MVLAGLAWHMLECTYDFRRARHLVEDDEVGMVVVTPGAQIARLPRRLVVERPLPEARFLRQRRT